MLHLITEYIVLGKKKAYAPSLRIKIVLLNQSRLRWFLSLTKYFYSFICIVSDALFRRKNVIKIRFQGKQLYTKCE